MMLDHPEIPPQSTAEAANSPFERVPLPLRQALTDRGFVELTKVQVAALDAMEQSRDLLISSQTGSGKTVALGLAMAPKLIAGAKDAGPGPVALVVVPTRELAVQVHKELEWLYAQVRGVRVDSVTGGTHVGQERSRLGRKPRILVGTPGRLVDHIGSGALDCSGVAELVLDEADQMLDMGFREELEKILAALPANDRRTHMLSATLPTAVRRLTESYQTHPLHVEGTRLGTAHEDIEHVGHVVRPHDRYGAVVNLLLLARHHRTLIFVATRAAAATLAEKLADDGFSALPLSGDFAQTQRTRTLSAFRAGTVSVLVATDVAARGLDVPQVRTVIHGDLPMNGEVYTHRSGRTGRAGQKGRSILLATTHGERRARRIFADARVEASWRPVPSAGAVRKALSKSMRRGIRKTIEEATETTGEDHLEFARSLLEGRDPAHVVATLIAGTRQDRVPEPFDFDPIEPSSAPRGTRTGAFRQNTASFTRFRINWGLRSGANPRRLLAAICRRGNVRSDVIGAIDIAADSATFEVANVAATAFEQHARRRDKRDPGQRIERIGRTAPRPFASAARL